MAARTSSISKRNAAILSLFSKGSPDSEVCRNLGVTGPQVEEAFELVSSLAEAGQLTDKDLLLFERARSRRLENALRATQDRFDALLHAMTEAVLLVDGRSGIIKRANERGDALFGYAPGDLVGRSVEELVPPQHRGIHSAYRVGFLASIRKREMGYHPPIYGKRADGELIEIAIALTATVSDDDVMVVCTPYEVWAVTAALKEQRAGKASKG